MCSKGLDEGKSLFRKGLARGLSLQEIPLARGFLDSERGQVHTSAACIAMQNLFERGGDEMRGRAAGGSATAKRPRNNLFD